MVSRTSMVSRKNTTVINFTQSRVSIGFSCTVLKIKNTGHSRLISPREVVQARFHEKMMVVIFVRRRVLSRVSIGFLCTISEIQNMGHSRRISPWEVVRA
ncbi:hypothetical protein BHM03_00062150 [Ensete ventricosum]|nr:hypothetical protein BHM03_00062150 [Ensete ventricosum]